jgi:sensor histidine kinase YesM/ligand-binding sensor domain-containing protein
MRPALRFILLWCCFILCNDPAIAQIEGNLIETSVSSQTLPFTITQYSTKDGLPQNQVTCIIPGKTGELILQTSNGTVEFNGYEFKFLNSDKAHRTQIFRSLHYFKNRNILMGHEFGLYFISPQYKQVNSKDFAIIHCVSTNDSLYIISGHGNVYLYLPDRDQFSVLFINQNPYTRILDMQIGSSVVDGKKIYLAGSLGLVCIDLASQKIIRLSHHYYSKLKKNPYNGRIYATSGQSIDVIENGRLKKLREIHTAIPFSMTRDLLFMDSTSFYMATGNGLLYVEKEQVRHYTKADGLPSSDLIALYYDSINRCIFAGSSEKGLLKFQFKNNYSFYTPDGPYKKSMGSVIRTANKQVLTYAGFSLYQLQDKELKPCLEGKYEYASLAEIDGVLYAGTWGGGVVLYKDLKPVDTLRGPGKLPHNAVHSSFKDSRGMLWIGTSGGLSKGKSNQELRPCFLDVIHEKVLCFYELRNGDICIGASDGAFIVRNEVIIAKLKAAEGYRGKEVRAFYEDDAGKLWIGTYGGGLFCYENKVLTSINAMKNCMLDEDVFCVTRDQYGYFYMTSNHGLWRISERKLNAFYREQLDYLIPFHYTEETGFLNTEFNGGFQNNFFKVDGYFLFPTMEGIVKTIPDKPAYNALSPEISGIWLNDTLLDGSTNTFERSTYSLQFNFQCVNLFSKDNVYFQHKLIGETNYEWSTPQKQATVYLKMLPPGKYTFMVRAINGFNDSHPAVTSYSFEIRPYMYETFWFKVLAAVALVALIIAIAMIRIANNRKKIEQKEYYKRKISEVELNAIQAQLNPHFIFNCMNTIKYFILEKDFTNANDGLNRLSRLIRNSMENSEKLFIPLKQEITFMTNYIDLEKMRLREQLEYSLIIAPGIDLNILIPHLFIQPYIENAIKHGIANLEDKQGILRIEMTQDAEYIICTVEDNGIGRKASGKLLADLPHISKGTRLTLEKSQLLKQYYNYQCSIDITDLYTDEQESSGTRVVIAMSKKYKQEI